MKCIEDIDRENGNAAKAMIDWWAMK